MKHLSQLPLQTQISREGQRYFDKPIEVDPRPAAPIDHVFAALFERALPRPIVVGHDRVRLRWMRPNKDGKLVPR